jgi:uncharacterized protein HemX
MSPSESDAKTAMRNSKDLNDYERREATQARNRDRSWHIDRGVPLALVVVLLVQAGGIVWWGSGVEKTQNDHERRLSAIDSQRSSERLATVESQLADARNSLTRIEAKLDRLVEQRLERRP